MTKLATSALCAAVLVVAVANSCCAPSPLAPSAPATPVYTCTTQPRQYCSAAGSCAFEIDHYTSPTPCPATPIR